MKSFEVHSQLYKTHKQFRQQNNKKPSRSAHQITSISEYSSYLIVYCKPFISCLFIVFTVSAKYGVKVKVLPPIFKDQQQFSINPTYIYSLFLFTSHKRQVLSACLPSFSVFLSSYLCMFIQPFTPLIFLLLRLVPFPAMLLVSW